MQSPKIGMIKLHLFFQKRVFTARATIMYHSIYMYLIIFSSFGNSSTDIPHLNQHAWPGVTAYVGIDNKRMKYVKVMSNTGSVRGSPNGAFGNFTNGTIGSQWYHWLTNGTIGSLPMEPIVPLGEPMVPLALPLVQMVLPMVPLVKP